MNNRKTKFHILTIIAAAMLMLAAALCLGCNDSDTNTGETNPPEPKTHIAKYIAGEGGTIVGKSEQTVKEGQSAERVYAQPDEHYEFTIWSDGHKEAGRVDWDLTADLTVTAYFELSKYKLEYTAGRGGYINGNPMQSVRYGESGSSVTAVAETGYYFVKWSDGITNESRSDIANGIVNVRAEFARYEYTVNYTAQEGGNIVGESEQNVYHGWSADRVKAEPNVGYEFVGWSDGKKNAERRDTNIVKSFGVTAQFRCMFASGKGTSESPFVIETYAQLCNMRKYPALCYELANDLDLDGIKHEPLFDETNPFAGTFEGKDFSIQNMSISGEYKYPSLFGYCGEDSCLKNFVVENASLTVSAFDKNMRVGAVACVSYGEINSVSVSATITGTTAQNYQTTAGGLVAESYGEVSNCESTADIRIEGECTAGGMVGILRGMTANCESHGKVEALLCGEPDDTFTYSAVGGFAGYVDNAKTIINCHSDCSVLCEMSYGDAGGFAGEIACANGFIIRSCSAAGEVTGDTAAGFAAYLRCSASDRISVIDCHSTGKVTGGSSGSGFVDWLNGEVKRCYSASDVTAEYLASGFAYRFDMGSISQSYAIGNVTSLNRVACGFIYDSDIEISECYTSGTVIAPFAVGGFVYSNDGIITNCYSTSNLIFSENSHDALFAAGLVSVNRNGSLSNSFYAGKISKDNIPDNVRLHTAGVALVQSPYDSVNNCHWLYYSDGAATDGCSKWGNSEAIEGSVRYENTADMYGLADTLNADGEEIWVNVENSFPQLKWCISTMASAG